MKTRGETAKEYFLKGYSCSQAIVLAFKDLINIDEEALLKISSPFGGGMGRLREVCGALSGAFIVLGYLKGNSSTDLKKKEILYKEMQDIAKEFSDINGFITCRNLLNLNSKSNPKPEERTDKYYATRPCKEIVKSAADVLEKHLSI